MDGKNIRKQTALLTAANVLVRALGFVMRVFLSRLMGAEALGVMELANSAHMLVVMPVCSGLPNAVSRMTAKEKSACALASGKRLARRLCCYLLPAWLLFLPVAAKCLGDARTLPALYLYLPCVPVLAFSAVYNGFCYGMGKIFPPALSELLEQVLRFTVSCAILLAFPALHLKWRAAVPAFSTFIAESAGLLLVFLLLKKVNTKYEKDERMEKTLFRLAVPLSLTRLCSMGLRTLCGVVIPLRLVASGLTRAEATARFGMLYGMVMPILMLPCMVTGALSMTSAPAVAAREKSARRLAVRLLVSGGAIGLFAAAAVYLFSDAVALYVYRQAEIAPLLRALCPFSFFMSVQQVAGGILNGMGLQKKALPASVAGSAVTLIITWILTAQSAYRLFGAAIGFMCGQALTACIYAVLAAGNAKKKENILYNE